MQDQLIGLDCRAQLTDQGQPIGTVLIVVGAVDGVIVTSAFCDIHSYIRAAKQRVGVVAIFGIDRDADACSDVERVIIYDEGLTHDIGEMFGELNGMCSVSALQQHRELVAAKASHGVVLAQCLAQARSDALQQAVAICVAERVVDFFESVEVDHQQGE